MCLNFLHDYKVTIHISEDELGNIWVNILCTNISWEESQING